MAEFRDRGHHRPMQRRRRGIELRASKRRAAAAARTIGLRAAAARTIGLRAAAVALAVLGLVGSPLGSGRAVALAVADPVAVPAGDPGPSPAAAALSTWTGGLNLYRKGVFTTQASWLYCTAADVQIMKNIVEDAQDHSSSAQKAYFSWMRDHNHYDLPLSAGVDPGGWAAGLAHYVDPRYRLVSSKSFLGTLKDAVTAMRLTNLPVAITVAHGDHGWVLNGFAATADPAVTADFEITNVWVTGPLYGLQSKNGYDMPPNTKLTVSQLKTFFTPWHYDPMPMIWDGTYVSFQPRAAAVGATPGPTSTPVATSTAAPPATASPVPTAPPTPTLPPAPTPGAGTAGPNPTRDDGQVAVGEASQPVPGPTTPGAAPPSSTDTRGSGSGLLVAGVVLAALLVIWSATRSRRRTRRPYAPPPEPDDPRQLPDLGDRE